MELRCPTGIIIIDWGNAGGDGWEEQVSLHIELVLCLRQISADVIKADTEIL